MLPIMDVDVLTIDYTSQCQPNTRYVVQGLGIPNCNILQIKLDELANSVQDEGKKRMLLEKIR